MVYSPGGVNGWPVAHMNLCVRERQLLWLHSCWKFLLSVFKAVKVLYLPHDMIIGPMVTQSRACVGQSDGRFQCSEHTNRQKHRLENIKYIKDIITICNIFAHQVTFGQSDV